MVQSSARTEDRMGSSNVRPAVVDDLPELMRMGKEFYKKSGYDDLGAFDPESLEKTYRHLISSSSLLITQGGMIGWVVFPVFVTGNMVAQELFWWVDPERRSNGTGKALLEAAEEQARSQGATAMMMLALDDLDGDAIAAVYGKMGYRPRERTYMRAL